MIVGNRFTNLFLSVFLLMHTSYVIASGSNQDMKFHRQNLDSFLTRLVDDKRVLGGALLIYKDNEELYYGEAGLADRDKDKVWQRDTLAHIYSMTKPITSVVLLSLYEEGLFKLSDPVSMYLPEFSEMSVATGVQPDGELILVPAVLLAIPPYKQNTFKLVILVTLAALMLCGAVIIPSESLNVMPCPDIFSVALSLFLSLGSLTSLAVLFPNPKARFCLLIPLALVGYHAPTVIFNLIELKEAAGYYS